MNDPATIAAGIRAKLAKIVVPDAEASERRRRRPGEIQAESIAAQLWEQAGVPYRHASRTISEPDLIRQPEWSNARSQVLAIIGRGVTVCLTGTRGNGKTQIAVEAIRSVTKQGKAALFITAQRIFMTFRGTFDDGAKRTELQVLESFRRPSLLVIDEIGQRTESDWENRTFFELLNARYNDMTDTILTCNLNGTDLTANLGPSLVDRMKEGGGMIECNWPSFRA